MPKAYSEDLRWRAVWFSLVRGMSYSEIATVLFMSQKSVYIYRYLHLFNATGTVEPTLPTGNCSNGLTDFEAFTVLQSILHQPKSYRNYLISLAGGYISQQFVVQSKDMDLLQEKSAVYCSTAERNKEGVICATCDTAI